MTQTRSPVGALQRQVLEQIDPLTLSLLTAAVRDKAAPRQYAELYDYAHERSFGERGERWRGRRPKDSDIGAGLDQDILRQLYMEDLIGPCLRQVVNAIVGRDFEWTVQEDGRELDPEDEIVQALSAFHRSARLHQAAKDACRTEQWSGRIGGRVFVPEEYGPYILDNRPGTLADALEFVHVAALDPREGGPLRDRHGRTLAYYYAWEERLGAMRRRFVELHTPEYVATLELKGLSFIPALRAEELDWVVPNPLAEDAARPVTRRAQFLLFAEDRDGGSAITRTARDMQDGLSKGRTYHSRNDDLAGFRSYVTTNAETPKAPDGSAAPWQLGPQMAANVVGLPKDESVGEKDYLPTRHTPTFEVIDPLNPEESTLPSIADWRLALLRAFDQLWTEAAADLQVSGEAQKQSRKAFDLRVIGDAANTALWCAWALKSAAGMAAALTDNADLMARVRRLTFVPTLFLDVQVGDLETFKAMIGAWKDGAIRLETALQSAPTITDAAAEALAVQQLETTPD